MTEKFLEFFCAVRHKVAIPMGMYDHTPRRPLAPDKQWRDRGPLRAEWPLRAATATWIVRRARKPHS